MREAVGLEGLDERRVEPRQAVVVQGVHAGRDVERSVGALRGRVEPVGHGREGGHQLLEWSVEVAGRESVSSGDHRQTVERCEQGGRDVGRVLGRVRLVVEVA